MQRVISAAAVNIDLSPYISPATGRVINSRTQMRDDLERSGHILNEPGLKQDVARWKTEADNKLFEPVARAVDEQVRNMVNTNQLES